MAVNFWLLYFFLYKKYFYRGMSIRSKAMISTVTSDKYEFSLTQYNTCIRQICHLRIELLREIFSYLEELICLLSKINWIAAWCPLVNLRRWCSSSKFCLSDYLSLHFVSLSAYCQHSFQNSLLKFTCFEFLWGSLKRDTCRFVLFHF